MELSGESTLKGSKEEVSNDIQGKDDKLQDEKIADELAPGWVELHNNEGIPYYYHEESQTTSWDKPALIIDAEEASSKEVEMLPMEEEISNDIQGKEDKIQ